MTRRKPTTKGFSHAASLMQDRIREGVESRGFTVVRLLTHWTEVVGTEMAAISRPVKVSYGRGGMGATLTVLTKGAHAPMLEMQKQQIRAKVNACYGYNAVTELRITQTAPTGFAEGQAQFDHAPRKTRPQPTQAQRDRASTQVSQIGNDTLRQQLEMLGAHILSKQSNVRSPQ